MFQASQKTGVTDAEAKQSARGERIGNEPRCLTSDMQPAWLAVHEREIVKN